MSLAITTNGILRNCLFASSETDLLAPLRRGEDIEPLIRDTVLAKHARLGGQLPADFHDTDPDSLRNRPMTAIGG